MSLELGVVIGGVVRPVVHPVTRELVRVITWRGTGPTVPEFRAGDGYNKPRTKEVDSCVWHWTGGEAEPPKVAETLRKRELGVEFAIGGHGAIFQFCDPLLVDTADAGILNSRSVGVEVVCYGFAGGWTWDPIRAIRVPRVPPLGRDRATYMATTHGRTFRTARFREPQEEAMLALADALSAALDIPRAVPVGQDGRLPTTVLPDDQLKGPRAFQGHLPHYMISAKKRDCGPAPIEMLREHFAGPPLRSMPPIRGVA